MKATLSGLSALALASCLVNCPNLEARQSPDRTGVFLATLEALKQALYHSNNTVV